MLIINCKEVGLLHVLTQIDAESQDEMYRFNFVNRAVYHGEETKFVLRSSRIALLKSIFLFVGPKGLYVR